MQLNGKGKFILRFPKKHQLYHTSYRNIFLYRTLLVMYRELSKETLLANYENKN